MPALSLNTIYLADFVILGIITILVLIVFPLRYRYYKSKFDSTVYQKRFRVGWLLTTVGAELACIGVLMIMDWLLQWPPLGQEEWPIPGFVIFSPGVLCVLVGTVITDEGFRYLRKRARRTQTDN